MIDKNHPQGATLLDKDEMKGLLLSHIMTRQELDRWEQDNINEALGWVEKRKTKDILNESFIKKLHKKMFCNVWKWAGKFRQSEKTLGVKWYIIPVELKKLFDDVQYWIDNKTFSDDETAARFHHRLVWIHPFPNGNGRHARLMADILLENILNRPAFTWGNSDLAKAGDDRQRYIEALVAADRSEFGLLLEFVRS